jgi:pyruvate dehydrogenase E1 component beta subunit
MKDGKISRWHVAEGQAVAAGDVLVEVVTPTASLEIEAENEGHVERILVPAGTEGVKVNTPIAILFGAGNAAAARGSQSLAQPLAFAGLEAVRMIPRAAPGPLEGAVDSPGVSYREALRDAIALEMRRDESVFVIGVEVAQNRGAPKVTQGLLDEFGPKRVVSVAAIDEALFGIAVGAAFAGLRPVVELPNWGRALDAVAPFLASAAETFYLSGGTLPVPIVFRGPNGFSPGMTGAEARCVAAALAQIPGLKVAQPATASAAKGLLQAAIRDAGPVAVLEHEGLYPLREAGSEQPWKKLGAARVARCGTDVTIAASGHAVLAALAAAGALSQDGIEAEVIDLMTVRPLDDEAVAASVARTGRLVTLEEGYGEGGIGAELMARIVGRLFGRLKSAPLRLAAASVPMPHAAELQAAAVPSAEDVVRAVSALIRGQA